MAKERVLKNKHMDAEDKDQLKIVKEKKTTKQQEQTKTQLWRVGPVV